MARQDAQDKKKRKNCSLCADKVTEIDYKDAAKLKKIPDRSRKNYSSQNYRQLCRTPENDCKSN